MYMTKQSLVFIISSFSSRVPLLSQLRKSVGPCSALYKYDEYLYYTIIIQCTSSDIHFLKWKHPLTVLEYSLISCIEKRQSLYQSFPSHNSDYRVLGKFTSNVVITTFPATIQTTGSWVSSHLMLS